MKVLLLAGGRGTRLLPYTTIIPKPLMPVGSRPILEILLLQLKKAALTDIILAVGYHSHLLRAYFGDGERLGIKLSYVEESSPMGTAGPIGMVIESLGERFIMMNGDLLTTLNLKNLIEHHMAAGSSATLGVFARDVSIDFGVLDIGPGNTLTKYDEKPTLTYWVSMGVYVIETAAVRAHVVPPRNIDAPDLMRILLAEGRQISCYSESCYWLDIGRPDDYKMANEVIDQGLFGFSNE
jgi:NDP-sugar pyrophosphorylase family protein